MEEIIYKWIFISIISGVFITVGVYLLLKKLKGDLEINISTNFFDSSETIHGQIKLKAKKPIDSRKLTVALVKEEYRSRGRRGEWVELFREEQILENSRKYGRNYSNFYDFSIKIPEDQVGNIKPRKIFGIDFSRDRRWRLIARVDAVGIDLDAKKLVYIKKDNEEKYPMPNN